MKHAKLAASLVLVAGITVGCGGGGGGGSDAPESASTDDFCKAYNSLFDSFAGATEPPSDEDSVKAIKDWADEMRDTGTPEDIPDDARRGFDLVLDTIDDIDEDATQKEIEELTDDLSDDDQKDSEAFGKYAQETCPMEVPSDLPTDLDTESP